MPAIEMPAIFLIFHHIVVIEMPAPLNFGPEQLGNPDETGKLNRVILNKIIRRSK
jgi:hypothetical protein